MNNDIENQMTNNEIKKICCLSCAVYTSITVLCVIAPRTDAKSRPRGRSAVRLPRGRRSARRAGRCSRPRDTWRLPRREACDRRAST